jgi:hypothetical protein
MVYSDYFLKHISMFSGLSHIIMYIRSCFFTKHLLSTYGGDRYSDPITQEAEARGL